MIKFVVDSSAYIHFANGKGEDYLKTNTKKIKAAMPSNTSRAPFYSFIYLYIFFSIVIFVIRQNFKQKEYSSNLDLMGTFLIFKD